VANVSQEEDRNGSPSYLSDDDAYAKYLRFMEDARRAILPLMPSSHSRQFFLAVHRPLSVDQFRQCLAALDKEPQRLARVEQLLHKGFVNQSTAAELQFWDHRLAPLFS
jgi:hypothetical protein